MDAASRLPGPRIRGRENLAQRDRLEVAQRLRAFDPQFQKEYWPSSAPICLANQSLQLRCRLPTIDAFTRHCRRVLKIVRDAGEIERRSSVYDDQIAGHSKIATFFAMQNCASQSCILSRAFAALSNWSALQSEVLWRNRELLHASARRAQCNKGLACNCHFIQAVGAVNDPRLFHAEKSKRRSHALNERTIPHAHKLKGRTRRIR